MDRSFNFPLLVGLSIGVHLFALSAAPHIVPPRLSTRTSEMQVRLHTQLRPPVAPPQPVQLEVAPVPEVKPEPLPEPTPVVRSKSKPAPVIVAKPRVAPAPSPPAVEASEQATVDVLPRPWARNRPPVYPERARRNGEEGSVLLRLAVDARGRVTEVVTVSSSGYALLDDAARDAAEKYRFEPAQRAGKAVAHAVVVPIRFELQRQSWARRR